MITLNNQTEEITVAHIRRNTDRDAWIHAVTRDVLGDGRGGPSRVIALKDAVASEFGRSRSLWFTVEHFPADINIAITQDKTPSNDVEQRPQAKALFPENWLEHIDWHFGFPVSRTTVSHGESINPVPLQDRWQKGQQGVPEGKKKGSYDPPDPSELQQKIEVKLLDRARDTINSRDKHLRLLRDVAEKWNLADLEAWRFVRAFRARRNCLPNAPPIYYLLRVRRTCRNAVPVLGQRFEYLSLARSRTARLSTPSPLYHIPTR